ncbi:MAG: D-alanyl-D-alanine carboxypeptidase/D-alanyl-D-alanine-endopeptidase [Dysgonamonadaceae bacterium]|jgi:D-alanyl-D-alanine carboxypeptidase/D-alanyl-D-alanine-endopeptidase (penicillin-binding protein 4)|nr:D-alanyl-D-alanine carboxypeptidase/D-alanyl-D-alanine-endopeptidase [Dysgonamonadaceae bacterium]
MHYRYHFLLWLACLAGHCDRLQAQYPAVVEAFVNKPSMKHAIAGIKVVEVETGKLICSCHAETALTPASTLKLLTTATALEMFGPDYRFATRIAYTGRLHPEGRLEGDLLIVGSGDPSLGSTHLDTPPDAFPEQWSTAVREAGIRTIDGDIVAVDHLYGYQGVSPHWMWGDVGNYYASPVYGISVFDNTYKLYFKTGAPHSIPEIRYTDPPLPQLIFDNHLIATNTTTDSAYIRGIPFSHERQLYGTLPAHRTSFAVKGDIPDPGMLLAQKLADYLTANGIALVGRPTTSRLKPLHAASPLHEIYIHRGNSLAEIVRATNIHSNNHFAEHLFHKIGWPHPQACPGHVPTLAVHAIRKFWQQRGIDTGGLFQYDGSGLSHANAITPSMLVSLLVYMQKQSLYAGVFYRSLPLAGKEGTVKSFLKGTSLEGRAHIKSGSITGVQSYAGYLEKNGKHYAFALIVNRFTGSRAALRKEIEGVVEGMVL